MTIFFSRIFTKYPIKTRRLLEIFPGLFSWTLILFPVWGSLVIPYTVAYFILFFDVYWLYKSFSVAATSFNASNKIKKAEREDWLVKASNFSDFKKVKHVVVIPNFKETGDKLRLTLQAIAEQTFPANRIYVALAMEAREENGSEKASILIKEFENIFGGIFATFHPDIDGEVKGKSSNQAFAGKKAYARWIESGVMDIDFATISSVDADSIFDKQYFSYLAHSFLKDEKRYNKFWQSANVNYNNFWKVPAPTRVIAFFGSVWRMAVLVQKDKLISNSTYSLSFKLLKNVDFWDTDVIPEDYRIFFKAYFMNKGNIWVEPIFLKTSMDAPLSKGFWKSIRNKYDQERRWSWGVSDDPLFIKWWLTVPDVPFVRKTLMLYNVFVDHFLWPVNWFIITIAANIITFINPVFSRTTLGYRLPSMAGAILTACMFALLMLVVVDFRSRPRHPSRGRVREFLFPLEFVLLPLIGFFLNALPALISHTQLMLGKRMEYKVTEKI
ncbi:MAG: glycosyltransferase family 2 protein [Patescibacteria group bacterium]